MKEYTIQSLNDLPEAASWLIKNIEEHSIVAFYGEMGAGKTTLIKEMCNQLQVIDNVSSPTFALINEYNTRDGKNIYHFDFYRINNIEEAFAIGYEDYFYSNNLCLVEWPEKIETYLPEHTLILKITVNEDESRKISVED